MTEPIPGMGDPREIGERKKEALKIEVNSVFANLLEERIANLKSLKTHE